MKKLLSLRTAHKCVMQDFTLLWFSAQLDGRIILRTGYLCCKDFLPFLPRVPRVYRHDDVKRLQVFQVNTSLLNKHYICALVVQHCVSLLKHSIYTHKCKLSGRI